MAGELRMLCMMAACAVALFATAAQSVAADSAVTLSRAPVAASERWRDYVLDPPAPYVYPRAVTVEGGAAQVTNPSGLQAPGGGATTISSDGSGSPTLVLDLGIDTGGTVEVGVASGTGTPVHLEYAEARRYLSPLGDNVEGSLGTNDVPDARWDELPALPASTWSSPAVRGGERWIALTLDGPGTVAIDYVRVHVTHLRSAPADYTGHFLSSDEVLNRAWYASAYTYDASVAGDPPVLMDGAKRDRMVFIGDMALGQMTGMDAVRAGPLVSRNSLRIFSCQQSSNGDLATYSNTSVSCPENPPDPSSADTNALRSGEYVAWYIVAARDYWWRTGDGAYVAKLLPVLRRAAGYLEANMEGDLYTGNHTAAVEYGWSGGSTPGAYTNIVLYRALRALAELERRFGDGERAAASDDALAERVRAALMKTLYDPAVGGFREHAGDAAGSYPQDANAEAIVAGILDGGAADRALALIRERMWTPIGTKYASADGVYISPFVGSWELLARMQHGDTDSALELIRREWGHMQDADPNYTVWEKVGLDGLPAPNQTNPGGAPTWRPEGEGYVSLAHAWGSGPVPALSEYVLGVRATGPGYRAWTIAPQLGDLRWAQGQVSTPAGRLVARWRQSADGSTLRLTVAAPRGTTGTVVVPLLGSDGEIARDGRLMWHDGKPVAGVEATRDGNAVRFEKVNGRHTYASSTG